MQFPLFDNQDVEDVTSELVDMSDCTLPHGKRRKLTGRTRFSVSVVRELFEFHHTNPHTKQTNLGKALIQRLPYQRLNCVITYDTFWTTMGPAMSHMFSARMVLAYKLQGGKIWFTGDGQADFVDKAL
ncbi:hypothetical protein BGZ59_003688 [Podila verticillata]|nr:hypothetical protein BGZ59_003688 [Podila verticillata]